MFWLELVLMMLVTAPFWWASKPCHRFSTIEIVLICPDWIPHIYVIRQLVIIESFWWFATYNPCRNGVLSANGLPQKTMSGSFA